MNPTFTHPSQPELQAEVILASQGPHQKPIYTIRGRYPRIIHAEAETHRVMTVDGRVIEVIEPGLGIMSDKELSRNARSSRAVPVKTMLNEVRTKPFIPWHWGKNQKGMQAGEECNELVRGTLPDAYENLVMLPREHAWLVARDAAADTAEAFMEAGYHKQIPNRLLEPYSWIDTLFTTTDIENFLWLRNHEDAEPHLQDFARLVKQAVDAAEIQQLEPGEWHLPYVKASDLNKMPGGEGALLLSRMHPDLLDFARKVSAARCAWISYKPFGGETNEGFEREMKTWNMLIGNDRIHASPLEHIATPDTQQKVTIHYGAGYPEEKKTWVQPHLHGNLDGYIQFRKTIPGERWVEGMV